MGMVMSKSTKIVAWTLAGALAMSTTPAFAHSSSVKWPVVAAWFTGICATSVVGAALSKNARQNKPLSRNEATSCGWDYWAKRR